MRRSPVSVRAVNTAVNTATVASPIQMPRRASCVRRAAVMWAPGTESKAQKTVADSDGTCLNSAPHSLAFHLPMAQGAQYDGGSIQPSCRVANEQTNRSEEHTS